MQLSNCFSNYSRVKHSKCFAKDQCVSMKYQDCPNRHMDLLTMKMPDLSLCWRDLKETADGEVDYWLDDAITRIQGNCFQREMWRTGRDGHTWLMAACNFMHL